MTKKVPSLYGVIKGRFLSQYIVMNSADIPTSEWLNIIVVLEYDWPSPIAVSA